MKTIKEDQRDTKKAWNLSDRILRARSSSGLPQSLDSPSDKALSLQTEHGRRHESMAGSAEIMCNKMQQDATRCKKHNNLYNIYIYIIYITNCSWVCSASALRLQGVKVAFREVLNHFFDLLSREQLRGLQIGCAWTRVLHPAIQAQGHSC